jgi:hypothetical protein
VLYREMDASLAASSSTALQLQRGIPLISRAVLVALPMAQRGSYDCNGRRSPSSALAWLRFSPVTRSMPLYRTLTVLRDTSDGEGLGGRFVKVSRRPD